MTSLEDPLNLGNGNPLVGLQPCLIVLGDDLADLELSASRIKKQGVQLSLIQKNTSIAALRAGEAAASRVLVMHEPLGPLELTAEIGRLREELPHESFKIVAQIRHRFLLDQQQLIEAGANYMLVMPVEEPILRDLLRGAMDDLAASLDIREFLATHKSGVGRMMAAVFEISTHGQAQKLATMLATNYPSPERVAIGIWELLANAIEHGNLEISHEEKTRLLMQGTFDAEIRRRLLAPAYRDRFATVEFKKTKRAVHLRVTDAGPGFDYKRFVKKEPATNQPNGRGIFIAENVCFDRMFYRGRGNIVQTCVRMTS